MSQAAVALQPDIPPRLPAWMGVRGFVDIHCHVLPGLDDGPGTPMDSRRMLRSALSCGTAAMIATPHFSVQFPFFSVELAAERLANLDSDLGGVSLFRGCELEITDASLNAFFRDPRRYTLNGSRYALVELMPQLVTPNLARVLRQFLDAGITPILAHPERYPFLHTRKQLIAEWVKGGGLLQGTAASFSQRMGKRAQDAIWDLVSDGWLHFVASDAHDSVKRPPDMRDAYRAVAERQGIATAARLFTHNPMAVLCDEQLP